MTTTTILKSRHLTAGFAPELARQIALTTPGQAHFADGGPFGATCGGCAFLGYERAVRDRDGSTTGTRKTSGCRKFHELSGKHGPAVPKGARACKYFEGK